MFDFVQPIQAEVSRKETGTFVSIVIVEAVLVHARHRTGCLGADHAAGPGGMGKLFAGRAV